MANMNQELYKTKPALPNKLLQEDGSITDLAGNAVVGAVDVYNTKPALPNKWLNPDGTYSTLSEILSGIIDTDLFVVVEELPASGESNKIYLLVQGDKIIEYIWVNNKWDPVGMIEFDINNYYTKDQVTQLITAALNAAKAYTDQKAVTFKAFPNEFDTTHTTQVFLNSIAAQNLPVGMAYLGQVGLSDMPDDITVQAEVEVYIYPQNVVYCVMRSAEVSPYQWECNSYEYRGWEPIDKTAKAYTDAQLTDYVKNTDYASSSKGGTIKLYNYLQVNSNGQVYADTITFQSYQSASNQTFIGKGTLENVITGKELVNKTYVDNLVGDIETILTSLDVGGGVV